VQFSKVNADRLDLVDVKSRFVIAGWNAPLSIYVCERAIVGDTSPANAHIGAEKNMQTIMLRIHNDRFWTVDFDKTRTDCTSDYGFW
jgi:hypothetical protein